MLQVFITIMRYNLLAVFILLSSCVHYATLYSEKNTNNKLAIQAYYSPCCGWCGQRVILDNMTGEQQSLLVSCKMDDRYSRYCTEARVGTQKHVDLYKGNTVYRHIVYRPVYDTAALKELYPGLDREAYFDSLLLVREMLPLTSIDAALINKAIHYKQDTACKSNYIKLIRGYVLVDSNEVKQKKETDFKSPK